MSYNRIAKTGERVIPEECQTKEEYLMYLRHEFTYSTATNYVPENSIVLDLGCGAGYGTKRLSLHVKHITGIDVDTSVVTHADTLYRSQECSFARYDGTTIPYVDQSFDAVVSFQVIEHVLDDILFVTEIHRVLKPGGICIITTPNRTNRLRPHQKPWNRFHVREYYPNELHALLSRHFREVTMYGVAASDDVYQFEMERIQWVQRMVQLDPLQLRTKLPGLVAPELISVAKKLTGRNKQSNHDQSFLGQYTINNYHLIREKLDGSLDLFAISKKY